MKESDLGMAEDKELKPKTTAKKAPAKVVPAEPIQYVHVEEFLEMAKAIYPDDINDLTIAGFKAYVAPKVYFKSELDLKQKLDTYLGKK